MLRAAALIIGLIAAGSARADDTTALYQALWAGVPAAEIRFTVHDGPDGYRNEIAIRAEGLARWITHFNAVATGAGRIVAGTLPAPSSFEARYDLRKRKNRVLNMRFARSGAASLASRGPGDTSRKPELAEPFRRNVIDPLGAFAAIRQQVREHPDRAYTIPAYDGARRFDVEVRPLPPGADAARHLALTLRPIAGFKGETSEDGDPDDAPRPVDLTLSAGASPMPLSLTVTVYFLPLTVEFLRWCTTAQPCPL